ncbi:MAG: phage terminase large subunit [Novosphingobium sp.]
MSKTNHSFLSAADTSTTAAAIRAAARENLDIFFMRCFEQINGVPIKMNWHIEAVCHQLERIARGECRRLVVSQPPRYLKTSLASIAFPAWLLGRNPKCRIICASYSAQLAEEFSSQNLNLMHSPLYRGIFPDTHIDPRKRGKTEFKTTAKGGRLATSVGGTLTGRGGDIIIIDDPLKADDAYSEAQRQNALEWFRNTIYSRLNDPKTGAIIIVSQRLHAEDLPGFLLEQGGWEQLILPLEFREERTVPLTRGRFKTLMPGDLLQENRHDPDEISQLRSDMGERDFEAQYNQSPAPPEGALFKRSWIRRYNPDEINHDAFENIIQSWDTAYEIGAHNDYSVCTTWGIYHGELYLLDILRERLTFPDLQRAVLAQRKKWAPQLVIVEGIGAGLSLYQNISGNYPPTPWLKHLRPEGSKEDRASQQTPKFERGEILFPDKADWLADLEKEFFAFPGSKHDDQVDSIVQFLTACDRRGWQGRGGTVVRAR